MKNPLMTNACLTKGLIEQANKQIFMPNGYVLLADVERDQAGNTNKVFDLYIASYRSGHVINEHPGNQSPSSTTE